MYFPIRCFTCGAVIGNLYEEYAKKVKDGKNPAEVLGGMGVDRYCCRRMFLSQADLMKEIITYKRY